MDILRTNSGSVALELPSVAYCQLEAFISYGLHSWEIESELVLAVEAGGKVSLNKWAKDIIGSQLRIQEKVNIIPSHNILYKEIVEKISI